MFQHGRVYSSEQVAAVLQGGIPALPEEFDARNIRGFLFEAADPGSDIWGYLRGVDRRERPYGPRFRLLKPQVEIEEDSASSVHPGSVA